jgi:acyl-homoserine lactone acylase PvdQ
MADLVPHELITALALRLSEKRPELKQQADALAKAAAAVKIADAAAQKATEELGKAAAAMEAELTEATTEQADAAAETAAEKASAARAAQALAREDVNKSFGELVTALAASGWLPDMVTFAGYLAEKVTQPGGGGDWQVLYTDLPLVKWLLVEDKGILYNTTIHDDSSPFQKRDVIWVDEDASVGMGMGSQSVEARFLTGEFTRAGDFGAPPAGGPIAGSTGVFCEARTVGCCTKKSTG